MKLVCCVKQITIVGDELDLTAGRLDLDPDALEPGLNEWDIVAVEEALRLKERLGGELVVVTCGTSRAETALRRYVAMGADRAIRVEGIESHDPIFIARALAEAVRPEQPDLIFCGVQSSDSAHAATGTALAELLGMPRVTVVTRIDHDHDRRTTTVHRELEGGLSELIEVDTPALLTIQTGTHKPRHPNLRAIKQAEQVEIQVQTSDSGRAPSRIRRMVAPPHRRGAELLTGSPAQIAARIAEIIEERLP